MNVKYDCGKSGRRGLTLIELVVVLVILVALAAIVVPQLPNMLGRAHTSASATNIVEVNKWMTTYHGLQLKFPDGYDTMMVGTSPAPYHPGAAYLTPTTLSSIGTHALRQLNSVGITQLADMIAAPTAPDRWSPTFNPYNDTGATPAYMTLTGSTNVLTLSNTMVNRELRAPLDAANTYVVFGLGQASTLVGKGVYEAPVHFEDGADGSPAVAYQRFGVVFRLNASIEKAEYVGAVVFHDEGIHGAASELSEYYKLSK